MLNKEDFILVELLGRDTPQVQALVAAAANPDLAPHVHEMLRSLARLQGHDPDHLPAFAIPHDLSPSDYPMGVAMSGDVVGGEVGLAEPDLSSHVGIFGTTSSGKTTLVKVLLLGFTGK